MSGLISAFRSRLLRFRREVVVVAYATAARDTPLRIRLGGLALLVYLLSPFDLLPELIPLIGILDDLAIVPWGISLLVDRIPAPQRAEAEARAERLLDRYLKRPLAAVALVGGTLVALWLLVVWLAWLWLR